MPLQDFLHKYLKKIFQKALGESVKKKENLWQKSFSDKVECSCKKIISAYIKVNVKQGINELVAPSYN